MSIPALLTASAEPTVKAAAQRNFHKEGDPAAPQNASPDMGEPEKQFADFMAEGKDARARPTPPMAALQPTPPAPGAADSADPAEPELADTPDISSAELSAPDLQEPPKSAYVDPRARPEAAAQQTPADLAAQTPTDPSSSDEIAPLRTATTTRDPGPVIAPDDAKSLNSGATVMRPADARQPAVVTLPEASDAAQGQRMAELRGAAFAKEARGLANKPDADRAEIPMRRLGEPSVQAKPKPEGALTVGANAPVLQSHAPNPEPPKARRDRDMLPPLPVQAAKAPSPQIPAPATTANPIPAAAAIVPDRAARIIEDKTSIKLEGGLEFSSLEGRSNATLHTTSGVARPEFARSVAAQMAEVIRHFPDKPVDLSLNPQELGKLRMSIAAAEGSVTIQILAERQETLDLIRRNIDQLSRDLSEMGFGSVNLAFGQGAQQSADDPTPAPEQQSTSALPIDLIEPRETSGPAGTLHLSDRTLDIRI